MKPLAVLYATREGQTRKIAEYVATGLRTQGFDVDVGNVRDAGDLTLDAYAGIVLAASVHGGKHEPEMMSFIGNHSWELNCTPNAFLTVTLSEAGAERTGATAEEHNRFSADVQGVIARFLRDSRWQPNRIFPVAGALPYSKYNFVLRLLMRWIAKRSGGETDTSRDYEYTDWNRLDQFVNQFAADVRANCTLPLAG
jgi:menaquinone-dependent protoporphyrinogen oxidase